MRKELKSKFDQPRTRINQYIRAREVKLINGSGELVGIVDIRQALDMAQEEGLDLVEISPNANPPICKLLDYGKYKYLQQKQNNLNKKKQKVIELKEIKLRAAIGEGDYAVKAKKLRDFLAEGCKVKVTLKFRGRENLHKEVGFNLLTSLAEEIKDIGKVEKYPSIEEGSQVTMIISKA